MTDSTFATLVAIAVWLIVFLAGLGLTVSCFDKDGRYRWPHHRRALAWWVRRVANKWWSVHRMAGHHSKRHEPWGA